MKSGLFFLFALGVSQIVSAADMTAPPPTTTSTFNFYQLSRIELTSLIELNCNPKNLRRSDLWNSQEEFSIVYSCASGKHTQLEDLLMRLHKDAVNPNDKMENELLQLRVLRELKLSSFYFDYILLGQD